MKKIDLLKAIVLILSGLFISCNKPQPIEDGISPVSPSEEVETFFRTYLPSYDTSLDRGFNLGKETRCLVINNIEKLEEVAPKDAELPVIDFSKHTLIIGRMVKGSPRYMYTGQKISSESGRMILTVTYKEQDGPASQTISYYNFWGLYDKLPGTEVDLNIRID